MISAWITPTSYPVKKYIVVYSGKYDGSPFECQDDKNQISIKVDGNELILDFGTYTKKLPYAMNEVCKYFCLICDAMKYWESMVPDTLIQHKLFVYGYEMEHDGVYYNTEDMR